MKKYGLHKLLNENKRKKKNKNAKFTSNPNSKKSLRHLKISTYAGRSHFLM